MTIDNKEDISLLIAIQKDDKKAFDRIFLKYYHALVAYSNRFCDLEDSLEIVQDVMLWLWENRRHFSVDHSLKLYLFKSVYHRSLTRIKVNEQRRMHYATLHERMLNTLNDVDMYQVKELSKQIREAIDELPESYKQAFIMNRFQHLSYKEIATILNISPKTVDYRIQQALKILRKDLKEYLPLFPLILNLAVTFK